MKIAYLSSSTIPSRMANSIHVMKICQAFADNGHEVELMASPGKTQRNFDVWSEYGIKSIFSINYCKRPGLGRLGSVIYGKRVSRKIGQTQPELLYGRCPHSLAWSSGLGIPFIYEAHVLPRGFMRKSIERFLFSRKTFKRLVVITDSLKQAYLENFSELSAEQVVVAHDGADVVDIAKISGTASTNNPMKVGYAGSLYPGKGMEIITALARAAPDYEYHVVGGNGLLKKWRTEAPDNVIFHGHVPPAKVSSFLSEFDVLLLPMQRNVETAGGGDIGQFTSPLKLFEYMAIKRPIVASKLPVVEEVLEHGKTGLLADPNKISEWKDALDQLGNDSRLCETLAVNAYEDFLKTYTWQQRAKNVLQGLI